jgi:hypothetical protein
MNYKFDVLDRVYEVNSKSGKSGIVQQVCDDGYFITYIVEFDGVPCTYYENELERFYQYGDYYNGKEKTIKCECGALKVYGKKTNNAVHALWCPIRK